MTETSRPGLLADFQLLLYLFVAFRLVMMMVYQPAIYELYDKDGTPVVVERGMSNYGDLRVHYFPFAQLSDDHKWPYRDYWHEFPPVWITLFIGVYRVMSVRGTPDFGGWATIIGLIMLLFDIGNLVLIRRIGRRLYGAQMGTSLAWIYAVLAAPVIFQWWTFETMVLFFMLLALDQLLAGRDQRSALSAALGTLTKYTPILILPTVWRFYDRRRALQYTVITLLIVGSVLGGLLAWGERMARASLLAQFNKSSYQTVWALIDGNKTTGSFPGAEERFDPDTAFNPVGNRPAIPFWLRALPFAALGLTIFTRRLRQDDQGVVAFFSITLLLFFLWSQGWSPQWVLTLSPLILLNFPNRVGVLACLLLTIISFAEYPVIFVQSNGEISGPLATITILTRTFLLVSVAVALYFKLTWGGNREQA